MNRNKSSSTRFALLQAFRGIRTSLLCWATAVTALRCALFFLLRVAPSGADSEKMGQRPSLPALVSDWKQRTGFAWHRRSGRRLWQKGYYDHILRSDEAHLSIARYIFENPVRAGLVKDVREYPWLGSDRFTVEEIMSALDALRPWVRPPIKGGPTR